MPRPTKFVGEIRNWRWLSPQHSSLQGQMYGHRYMRDGSNVVVEVQYQSEIYSRNIPRPYFIITTLFHERGTAYQMFHDQKAK